MRLLGIDPGASGGFAILDVGLSTISTMRMPETERDRWLAIKNSGASWCVIEQLGPMPAIRPPSETLTPRQPYARNLALAPRSEAMRGSVANFKVGSSYGALRAFLIAAEIPFEQVVPRKWQTAIGCPHIKGESRKDHKNRLKGRAQQLFPTAHITLATADAVLLAEYARLLWNLRNPTLKATT